MTDAGGWQDGASGRPQPTLQPIADDGVADFLGDGEADPQPERIALTQGVFTPADEEDEPRRRRAAASIGGDEILARCHDGDGLRGDRRSGQRNPWRDYALSFARPLARRLARTLRPPGVAIRARNP